MEATPLGRYANAAGLKIEGEVKLNAKCWTRVLVRKAGTEATTAFHPLLPHPQAISPVTALLISPDVTAVQWVEFFEKARIHQLPLQLYFFGTTCFFLFLFFLILDSSRFFFLLSPKGNP